MTDRIKINGKDRTTEESIELLKKESTVVHQVSIGFDNPSKKTDIPMSNEGFEIPQDIIAGLSVAMDEYGAEHIIWTMSGSPYIRGRTLIVRMEEPKPEPTWFKSKLIKLGKWLQE